MNDRLKLGQQNETLQQKILIMVSVEAEREVIRKRIGQHPLVDIEVMGVGPASSAAVTARRLAQESYKYVLNVGIGGGFKDKAPIGSFVVSTEIVAADLGSESPERFLDLAELGLGTSKIGVNRQLVARLTKALEKTGIETTSGQVLTLSTVTGTKETTEKLIEMFPDAKAEAMEGFGVATAAALFEVPVIEIRAISNVIGPRDRDAWQIKTALQALEEASSTFVEVFL